MIRTIQSVNTGREFAHWIHFLDANEIAYTVSFEEECRILISDSIAVVWCY